MANASENNIRDLIISGIKNAAEKSFEFSNGIQDLSWEPEYFLTTMIAGELRKLKSTTIYMEENMEESHTQRKGRPSSTYKPKNRYDIVIRDSSGYPRAALEVKHRVYSCSKSVRKDIRRLGNALRSRDSGPDFSYGFFAFYTVFYPKERKSPKEAIERLYTRIESAAKEEVSRPIEANLKTITPSKFRREDYYWGGGCLTLSRKE